MKNGWHTKHFLGGWKTFKSQPALLLIAPIASIIGLGALIDSILYAYSFLFGVHGIAPALTATTNSVLPPDLIGPTIVSLVSHPVALLVTIAVLACAILCQTALIHVTHRHSRLRKQVSLREAFRHALTQWPRMTLVHLASLSAVFLLVLDMSKALDWITGPHALWFTVPIMIIDGLLILYVLTIKMLILQFIAGDGQRFLPAVQQAWKATWRSPALILEHNLILFVINAVAMTLLVFAVQLLSLLTSAIGTWVFIATGNQGAGSLLELVVFLLGSLFVAGIVASYNFATWSHLAKNIERKHLPAILQFVFRKS
ncbi:hypothetical protein COV06_01760 [Candidatus Uhrbacteria bacterium CG10_big_fil_rev_8_21_14_0_10_50_16]|uniref:Uncharacterized protein n=1 Tax=Candidatus Uhrbacteria bacterium CG10_big_fil_rev_8_21_14_0_10_50_16 TaxID=1975039 RepID=A0A2H0RMC9_9BACT|nr:MAG: hypothetical protein COV06_01760 [Candidatus Uhrbacteria bacterium CG10_big_fil_rev_8_21_14_0_10_50_16]